MPVLALVSQGTAEAPPLSAKRRTASGGSVIDSEAKAHLLHRRADSALALDLDPGRGRGPGGATFEVSGQADAIVDLVARLGGRCVTDVSPRGGRHVYVLFAAALPWRELRDLARALSLRYPPGARHKSGGWRVLSMRLEGARAAAEQPNGRRSGMRC